MTALGTLWLSVDGTVSLPVTCGPKPDLIAAGRAIDAAGITLCESEVGPCCRDPQEQVACIRDQFADDDDELAVAVIREACARAGAPLPDDIAEAL